LGPLSDAAVIDCDSHGVIDLAALRALNPQDWDGVVITNPFATATSLQAVVDYARQLGKRVIVDNAAALFSPARTETGFPDEVISFHHTKPWGFGEGGCAIVRSADATTARALTNFGVGLGDSAKPYAGNSKMSEFDAALILQRLVNTPNWARLYELQRRRILSIAAPLGLNSLQGASHPRVVSAHVPLLASSAISLAELENPIITLRKYYRPLAEGHARATDIFDRIVCVPCHPQVAHCPTDRLRDALARIEAKSRRAES
jgi:dTDP-4-amino-4,6-dideoxygalactose transaminase